MSGDKEWERRRRVIDGEPEQDPEDSNVTSTDHTESKDDTSKSETGNGEGTDTQAEPDEQTAVQGDGPNGEAI